MKCEDAVRPAGLGDEAGQRFRPFTTALPDRRSTVEKNVVSPIGERPKLPRPPQNR